MIHALIVVKGKKNDLTETSEWIIAKNSPRFFNLSYFFVFQLSCCI